MIIRKAFKYRIYPNQEQQEKLAVQFGHSRYIYNWGLAQSQERYAGYNRLAKQLPILKACEETSWLKEAYSQVLQQSLKNLDRAFKNFFEKRGGDPQFKSKRARQSIRYPQPKEKWIGQDGRRIYLPKVGYVPSTTGRRDEERNRIEDQEREILRQHSSGSRNHGTDFRWRNGWHRSGTAGFCDPVQRRKDCAIALLPEGTAETSPSRSPAVPQEARKPQPRKGTFAPGKAG